jgi:hypothetical protein
LSAKGLIPKNPPFGGVVDRADKRHFEMRVDKVNEGIYYFEDLQGFIP